MNNRIELFYKILIALPILAVMGSCANYNSNSNDATAYRARSEDLLDGNFLPVYELLMNKCYSCHPHHDYFASLTTSQKWVDAGQVVKGDPDNSYLIRRLRKFGGGTNSNMPYGNDITDDEYQLLRAWITNIP